MAFTSINVVVPDAIRFSSTLIFFTELILVFSAIFIIAVIVMSTLQLLVNKDSHSVASSKQQLLMHRNDHDNNNNIFQQTVNKTKNVIIWAFLVFLASLSTIIYYLLTYTTIVTPLNTPLSCTALTRIGNAMLIISRCILYLFWNEYMLHSTSVYVSFYIHNNHVMQMQYTNLKPIKSLPSFKKRMQAEQHDLNQDIHNRFTDGEQYLYYKIFYKYYIYRVLIAVWSAVYFVGLMVYTDAQLLYLKTDSNSIDDDGIACKEIFDALSPSVLFYTFGLCCDVLTVIVLLDEYLISVCTNLQSMLRNEQTFKDNIYVLEHAQKNATLAMISMCTTLLFRLLSFGTGLEATFYPLMYTVCALMIFLVFRFNEQTYEQCCGKRTEKCCFAFTMQISRCCYRYKYARDINAKSVNQRIMEIKQANHAQIELQLSRQNYL